MRRFILAAGLAGLVAQPVFSDEYDALRADSRIHNGLLVIMIGSHIQDTCPTIEARSLSATGFMFGLARHAMSLGYSRAQVERYVDDEEERARFETLARTYFAQHGVTSDDDVEGACRVGEQEMTDQTSVGRLLRHS
ncbi:DUF5333 domain-containing protein [Nioella nitratireducens]|uniref:DUF5333 domain-containing protein n=1 Tax=Nioella nitratireducens TaxID=1287720 RepID=UPI0008FD6C6F|nr:DUF5333 domain-containing protein [Nioella nitratireducens]